MKSKWLILAGACSYGVLSTFVVFAYDQGFTVDEVVGGQNFIGFLLMALVFLASRFFTKLAKSGRPSSAFGRLSQGAPLQGKDYLGLLGVGLLMASTGMLYYGALQSIPASLAIVLLFQFSWIGVLVDALLLRRLPSGIEWAAIAVLFAGTLLAGGVLGGGIGQVKLVGILLSLGSAVTYALFILLSGRVAPKGAPLKRSLVMSLGSLLLTLAVYPPAFLTNGSLLSGLLLWALLLALFGAVIPTLFYAIGVPGTGGTLASILSAAELPTAVLMSAFVLRETVTLLQWLGVIIILVGIVLPEWKKLKGNG
ncbi:EamA family transporter [Gorillibacterium timonense]|uniref:EamA family transporter n=1 Tax=Gorillibacterium timonense TaxID=1689269 RepID=UPI00071D46F3|nr:DMT family transporter [Gorillibacterium timonense]